jgi:hypothetical protein
MLGMDIWKDLTTREMQAYGAFCLYRFCKAKGIRHESIDELIDHLLSMLISSNLADWERRGARLQLNGRGWDPLPASLNGRLSEELRKDFAQFVEDVVDIGFCDMYGAASTKSLKYLVKGLAFLDEHGIERPDVAELFKNRSPRGETAPELGEVFSQERHEQVKALFR